MEYNDEPILSLQDYEVMAKEYNKSLKKRGFIFVQIDNYEVEQLVEETFNLLANYSLNERQIKKMRIMFDYEKPLKTFRLKHDKTTCFLTFVGLEIRILKNLLLLCEKSNFEREIRNIYKDRISNLEQIFPIN